MHVLFLSVKRTAPPAFVEVSRRRYCRRHHSFHYVSWRWKSSRNNADIGNGFFAFMFFFFWVYLLYFPNQNAIAFLKRTEILFEKLFTKGRRLL